MSPLRAFIVVALGLSALTVVSAQETSSVPTQSNEQSRICLNVPRQGSRISDRVCGSPEQLAQREQNRLTWMELLSAGATVQPGYSEQPNAVP